MERLQDPTSGAKAFWGDWLSSGLLDAIGGAVIVTDLRGEIVYVNLAAEVLYGYPAAQMVGENVRDVLVLPGDLAEAESIMSTVLGGESWSGEFPVRLRDGSSVTVKVTDSPLWRNGQVVGVIGVADVVLALDEQATAARLAEARIARLAVVTAELAGCSDVDHLTSVVISHVADAVGASVASLSLLTGPDTLELVGLRGGSAAAGRWAAYALSADLPTSESLRMLAPVALGSRDEIEQKYPALLGSVGVDRAMVCLPLSVDRRRLGVISLGFPEQRLPDAKEMQFLVVFSDTCAQALERLQALEQARTSAARIGLLADVSIALAQSLDYRTTLATVARLTVPTLADWCAVQILEDGELHTVAVEHSEPAKVALALAYQQRYPPDPASTTGPYNVLRTGQTELYPEITDEMLVASARDEDHLRLTRELGLASVIIVPLTSRGRILGVITLVSAESGRRLGPSDAAFAENLARRAGAAIDNAHLFTQTRETALRLQRAILPSHLPRVQGLEIACHYAPAGDTEVGGDFYDALVLPDGRIAVFLGDVAGRGIPAAAAMAQIRAAIRAYAAIDPDPAVVFTQLDRMASIMPVTDFVTVIYILLDASLDTYSIISAGHLPALLVNASGDVSLLSPPIGTPLGISMTRTAVTVSLAKRDTILLYSDGLVERRNEPIDVGIDRLSRDAQSIGPGPLSEQLLKLARLQDQIDDDVTMLAMRRTEKVS